MFRGQGLGLPKLQTLKPLKVYLGVWVEEGLNKGQLQWNSKGVKELTIVLGVGHRDFVLP